MRILVSAALVMLLVSGCFGEHEGSRPSHDLQFRLVDETGDCAQCTEAVYKPEPGVERRVMLGEAFVHAEDVVAVRAFATEEPYVYFQFSEDAARRLEKLTSENVGRRVAVVSNGQVVSVSLLTGPFSRTMHLSTSSKDDLLTTFFRVVHQSDRR